MQSASDIQWIQISDLHLRGDRKDGHSYSAISVLDSLCDLLRKNKDKAVRPDIIFITGDIAFSGQDSEYEQAGTFFDNLLESAGLDKRRLFLVPGNHDVDRTVGRWLQRTLSTREESDDYFSHLLHTNRSTFHPRKLDGFTRFVDSYFQDTPGYSFGKSTCGTCLDPIAISVKGIDFSILPTNTALFAQGDDDFEKLWIGQPCIDRAVRQLDAQKSDIRIALMHHPISFLHPEDRKPVEARLFRAVDFVLCGHTHEQTSHTIVNHVTNHDLLQINSGASFQGASSVNSILHVSLRDNRASIVPYKYSQLHSGWIPNSEMFGAFSKDVDLPREAKERLRENGRNVAHPASTPETRHDGLDLASMAVSAARDVRIDTIISDLTGVDQTQVERLLREAHGDTRLASLFGPLWPSTSGMGKLTVARAHKLRLYGTLAALLVDSKLSWQEIRARLDDASGKTHIRNVFRSQWPQSETSSSDQEEPESEPRESASVGVDDEAIGAMTASRARQRELERTISEITNLRVSRVERVLASVHGKTLIQNVFDDRWPSPDELMNYSAAKILRLSLVGDLAEALGRDSRDVRAALEGTHGKTLVKNLGF